MESRAQDQQHFSQISNWSEEELHISVAGANVIKTDMCGESAGPLEAQLRNDLIDVGSSSDFIIRKRLCK